MLRAALLITLLLVILLAGWIVIPMLVPPAKVSVSNGGEFAELMALAPQDADTVIGVATFGPAWHRYSPLLAPIVQAADAEALDRAAWLAGRSPVVTWTTRGDWGAVAEPDPLRRILARIAGSMGLAPIRVEGNRVLFGTAPEPGGDPFGGLDSSGLEGHAFVVHNKRGGYPPLGRPAISAAVFENGDLAVVSRAAAEPKQVAEMGGEFLPRSAPISMRFAAPPKALLTLEQAFPVELRAILEDGGMVALYGVETKGLLPRPLLAFSVPADERRAKSIIQRIDRATTQGALGLLLGMREANTRTVAGVSIVRREGVGLTIEFAQRPGEFLLAFDRSSLQRLLEDDRIELSPGAAAWEMRAQPRDLLPILEQIQSNTAIRLLAEDFAREAGDLAQIFRSIPTAEAVGARLEPAAGGASLRAAVQLND